MIPSDKPLKKCPFCGKEIRNLGYHVAQVHPQILEKLEESSNLYPQSGTSPQVLPTAAPNNPQIGRPLPENRPPVGDINSMIREKLDVMLNIKIIEMLSKSPDVSLQQISQAMNPPQPMGIREIKEYHDLFYPVQKAAAVDSEGEGWIDLATAAIPLIEKLIPAKKEGMKIDESRGTQDGGIPLLRPIQQEITGDPAQPASPS